MKLRKFVVYFVLVMVSIMCVFWVYTLFINATRSGSNMYGIRLIPSVHLVDNLYGILESAYPVVSAMKNSILISVFGAAGCVYFASLCAYGFHMFDFPLKKALFVFLVVIMMIPTQVSILGYVDLARKMRLTDSLWSVILPRMAVPITFYYVYQFMKINVSQTYIEAARIDGAGEMLIFHSIIIPLLKPAVAVQFIFEFVNNWNSYFVPAVLLISDNKKTMSIVVTLLRSVDAGAEYAMMAIAILPITIMYILLSKQIINGIMAGGIKE